MDEEDVHGVSDVSAGIERNAIGKLLWSQTHSTHGRLHWEYAAPMATSEKGAGPVADARVKRKCKTATGLTSLRVSAIPHSHEIGEHYGESVSNGG